MPDINDPGATHYYGDGCDDDHGRTDHESAAAIAAQFIDDCRPFLIEHADHLIEHPYDSRYLYDPVHHFIAERAADRDGAGVDSAAGR